MWPVVSEAIGSDGVLDEAIEKRGAEFLVAGNAWPEKPGQSTSCRVRVRLGTIDKTLNVFGDRFFEGDRITEPTEFESIPLRWERAFGGEGFARNPFGKGVRPVTDAFGRKSHPLPNIEHPEAMIGLPGQKTDPAGFGPIPSGWPQRQRMTGKYDRNWFTSEYPGFASDIDWAFFNVASSDQQQAAAFVGNEEYLLEGLHPDARQIEGALPGFCARTFIRRQEQTDLEELRCALSTVWFFPELEHGVLVFHASTRVEQPDASDLTHVLIAADDLDSLRSERHYSEVFARRMDPENGVFEAFRDQDLLPESMQRDGMVDVIGASSEMRENIRTNQLRRMHKVKLAEGSERLSREMNEIGVELPPEPEMPNFGFNPEDPSSIRLEQLPEIIDRVEAYSEQERQKLTAFRDEAAKRLEAGLEDLNQANEGSPLVPPPKQTGPPDFSANERITSIEQTLAELESAGVDVAELRGQFLGKPMLETLRNAERDFLVLYRRSAHFQEPAPRGSRTVDWAERLQKWLQSGNSLDGADFTGATLAGVDLSGADLSGILLESADLSGADIRAAVLDGAVLAHATLDGVIADKASFRGANLGRASLIGARLAGADLSDAELTGANLEDAVLDHCVMNGVELRDACVRNTRMAGVVNEDLLLIDFRLDGQNFAGARLSDAIFLNCSLAEVDFSEANLDGAVFLNAQAVGATFEKASMVNARLVEDCDCTSAIFRNANMSEAYLASTRLVEAVFSGANVSDADLSFSPAGGSNFCKAIGISTRFVSTDLREADLSGSNLMQANLERVDLRGGSLHGANLYGADLARIHVDPDTDFENALATRMRVEPRRFRKETTG